MKKSTIQAVDKFVGLVGGSSWLKIKVPCTGKWAGTWDHGILIDGRYELFVSNGMSGFEDKILEWNLCIQSFNSNKEDYLNKIRMQVEQDNKNAILENMNPITVLDIGIISPESNDSYYFFLPFVLLDVNGKQYKFTESGLNNAFLCNSIDKWLAKAEKPTWTAGGVKNPNFIFCGVRYNSEDGMYCIR